MFSKINQVCGLKKKPEGNKIYKKPKSKFPITKLFFRTKKQANQTTDKPPLLLTEVLGSGATASVYLCREYSHPHKIMGALKVFNRKY